MSNLEEIEKGIQEVTDWWLRSDGSPLIAHTSGSTGKPKCISLPRQTVIESARRTIAYFNLDEKSHLHLCLSPKTIAGKMLIIRALECRGTLTYELPSNNLSLSTSPISLLPIVPSQMVNLFQHRDELPRIDAILVGGSAIPQSLRRQAAESGLPFYESYGMTETASHIALRPLTLEPQPFKPLEGISVFCDDRDCLNIRMPHGECLATNDIAEVRDDGSFVIKGRYDNMIITGGIKVQPEEIEQILSPLLPGRAFYVAGRPDEKWGEKVVLVIEGEEKLPNDFEQSMADLLSFAQRPKEIILSREPLKRTISGKLLRI